ncbi:GntR family transcriptional regulator [Amycolatopsis sp. NPDC059021]|uniref:GntR family transcriptional regulator n=1 Tax=Amycolatopsis sp. NPDC059021 TaxID=3346704 RepID=UPI00366DBA01
MDKLDPNDPRSPYLQVSESLRSQILSGAIAPGEKLPSYQALADDFGVSVGTVKRAFAQLVDDQLIVTRQGQGSYVRNPLPDVVPEPASADLGEVYEQLAAIRRLVDSVERQLRAHG